MNTACAPSAHVCVARHLSVVGRSCGLSVAAPELRHFHASRFCEDRSPWIDRCSHSLPGAAGGPVRAVVVGSAVVAHAEWSEDAGDSNHLFLQVSDGELQRIRRFADTDGFEQVFEDQLHVGVSSGADAGTLTPFSAK